MINGHRRIRHLTGKLLGTDEGLQERVVVTPMIRVLHKVLALDNKIVEPKLGTVQRDAVLVRVKETCYFCELSLVAQCIFGLCLKELAR